MSLFRNVHFVELKKQLWGKMKKKPSGYKEVGPVAECYRSLTLSVSSAEIL